MSVKKVNINRRDNFFVELVGALKATDKPLREIHVSQEHGIIHVADDIGTFVVTLIVEPGWEKVTVEECHHHAGGPTVYDTYTFMIDDIDSIIVVIAAYLEAV